MDNAEEENSIFTGRRRPAEIFHVVHVEKYAGRLQRHRTTRQIVLHDVPANQQCPTSRQQFCSRDT